MGTGWTNVSSADCHRKPHTEEGGQRVRAGFVMMVNISHRINEINEFTLYFTLIAATICATVLMLYRWNSEQTQL